ncbi:sugar kinase [Curtobacterium sp. RRHDQ10]|uniref:sugar kinase n=1 Tax=Curtobacterium phyllosphaerae TaxID=3413379 RepID=UPI003BF0A7E5
MIGEASGRAARAGGITDGGVVTFGETMLLLVGRGTGTVADLGAMRVDTGGAESNTAIGLARLHVPVTWVGRVGADPAGDRVLRDVRRAGVTTVAITDTDRSTGLMMKERLPDGRTRVTYHRRGSAGSALEPADLPDGLVERAALLHLTGITLALSDTARDTVHAALDRAEGSGVPVSFDVNHRPKLIADAAGRERYRTVARRSSIVFAGDDEARLVLDLPHRDDDEPDLALRLADLASGHAVVKMGSRGAVVAVDGEVLHRAATPVHVVDPVGAGDAFVAAYLAARLRADPPARALDLAAEAGALACTVDGDWHSLPDADEIAAEPAEPRRVPSTADRTDAQPGPADLPGGRPIERGPGSVVHDRVDR